MNGFPVVILGVMLFALAYILWKMQGKIGEITGAVDRGFKTIENGITQNMLGPTGFVPAATTTLNNARDVFYHAGNDIQAARILVAQDIGKIVNDSEAILGDVGNPLITAGKWLNNIGDDIPFGDLAQPFHDVGNTVDDIGDKCLEAKDKLVEVSQKLQDAASSLDALSQGATSVGREFDGLSRYTGTTFRTGVETSVHELEQARTFLDSELLMLADRRLIAALAVLGVIFIVTGVSIGL